MITFEVPDMTCGHCVKKITEAVQTAASDAMLECDVPGKTVTISSASAAAVLETAIRQAGFSPKKLEN